MPPDATPVQRLEAAARLAGAIAQDVNAALSVIQTESQRLIDGLSGHPLRGAAEAIQAAHARMAVLAQRLSTEMAALAPGAAPPARMPAAGVRTRVLIVEDERPVRELLRTILERGGFDVRAATTAEEALQVEAPEGFDLLITDVMLPKMTGPELARALTSRWPSLRVLFMSGYTGGVVLEEDDFSGARAFIQKPFGSKVLLDRVRRLLDPSSD